MIVVEGVLILEVEVEEEEIPAADILQEGEERIKDIIVGEVLVNKIEADIHNPR